MSTVRDRGVIDITVKEEDRFILIILDDLEWTAQNRRDHAGILQDKINDYLAYISSGQAEEAAPGKRPLIRILAQYSYSRYCLEYLERVRNYLQNSGGICDIEWTHDEKWGPFEDGFSDDLIFDETKIYPRLKKNWAKNPLLEVSLMAVSKDAENDGREMVMFRVMDSYIGMFLQDTGNAFTYLTYDHLPQGITPEDLERIAFDNLVNNVKYQIVESREPGIYGILAGGDFEAESICLNDIWKSAGEMLGDDAVITVPTKDIVFFTKASDRKLRKKMMKMAENMFLMNTKESPYLLFSKDIFLYSRKENRIQIIGQR